MEMRSIFFEVKTEFLNIIKRKTSQYFTSSSVQLYTEDKWAMPGENLHSRKKFPPPTIR
jgi:hypothetical protein